MVVNGGFGLDLPTGGNTHHHDRNDKPERMVLSARWLVVARAALGGWFFREVQPSCTVRVSSEAGSQLDWAGRLEAVLA